MIPFIHAELSSIPARLPAFDLWSSYRIWDAWVGVVRRHIVEGGMLPLSERQRLLTADFTVRGRHDGEPFGITWRFTIDGRSISSCNSTL
jgi:hypothetical protein